MIENLKSTILPIALWTENPPIHSITSILHLDKSSSIVTGCECGHIIIWSAKQNHTQLIPLHYLISHRSKVVALVLAGSRKHTDVDYFVSFSKNGEVGLWEAVNGRSIEFVSNPSFEVQSVFAYESENMKQRLLFCCLKSPEIIIINSMSLSEICTLVCTNSSDMFSAVTSFTIPNKDDAIFASTVSGQTSMWILNFSDINNKPFFNPKFKPDESIDLNLPNPIRIIHNPFHTNIILIISASKFMIYHAKNWSCLCCQDCCPGDGFMDGEFILINCILIHCESGKSLYYKLPPRSDFENSQFGKLSSDLKDSVPKLQCQFNEPKSVSLTNYKVATKISEKAFVIWKGCSDGNICRYDFKANCLKIESQIFNLPRSWKNIKKKSMHLDDTVEKPNICGSVTSLLYLEELSLLVLGMQNGSIYITDFYSSLSRVFQSTTNSPHNIIKLFGHIGSVLCLLHPCSSMKLPSRIISCYSSEKPCLQLLRLTHILWSGGEDFTIRIWDIKTKQCLNIFHCHSSPIVLLRLNTLPPNSMNIFGSSHELVTALASSSSDGDSNIAEIRQIINTCMNAFVIAISEDDGISVISMMKRKLLLHSILHDAPIKRLGWAMESDFLLLETINNTVYIWDLNTKKMERYEIGDIAQVLINNCSATTKVRSHNHKNVIMGADMIARHSIDNLKSFHSFSGLSSSNKFIKFQFIKTGSSDRFVPVIIIDFTVILNSMDSHSQVTNAFYNLIRDVDNVNFKEKSNKDIISNFDTLMMQVSSLDRQRDIKILLLKVILSQSHFYNSKVARESKFFEFLDLKESMISCSVGQVNSKTGCITFSLRELFKDDPPETKLAIQNTLLQLSISNTISSQRVYSPSEDSRDIHSIDVQSQLLWPSSYFPYPTNDLEDYCSFSKFTKFVFAYKKTIVSEHVPQLLKKTGEGHSNCPEILSFYTLETFFNSLVLGFIDESDWISTSALQVLVKVISVISCLEIQNYVHVLRMILLPDLDHYTTESGRHFFERIQTYLHRFSEQSFFASDWIWWYSSAILKIDQDKRNLSKIQIKSLVYLALIGTYMQTDDNKTLVEDKKTFNNVFSPDNFFLARITCDFLLNLLTIDPETVKKTKDRLITLAMVCLSNGFTVWEPYLNSSTLICQLFQFTEENEDNENEHCFILSDVAKRSLRHIALNRPLVFIMVCYREILRLQNGNYNYEPTAQVSLSLSGGNIQRMKSSPAIMNSYDPETVKNKTSIINHKKTKKHKGPLGSIVSKKNVLFSILEELCDTKSELISELLPEIVEIYLTYQARFSQREVDLQHLLYPFLKFSSVSINTSIGQIGVGSSKGCLALFDFKTGKYFTKVAHKQSIKYTKFSNDAKHIATYSVDEGLVQIWQISHTGLFHLSNNLYNVKMVLSEVVPGIEDMMLTSDSNVFDDKIDGISIKKKRRSFKRTISKVESQPELQTTESGLRLNWHPDNKTLAINLDGHVLRKFKL